MINDKLTVYLDTSVLAKWYLAESNSEQEGEEALGFKVAMFF